MTVCVTIMIVYSRTKTDRPTIEGVGWPIDRSFVHFLWLACLIGLFTFATIFHLRSSSSSSIAPFNHDLYIRLYFQCSSTSINFRMRHTPPPSHQPTICVALQTDSGLLHWHIHSISSLILYTFFCWFLMCVYTTKRMCTNGVVVAIIATNHQDYQPQPMPSINARASFNVIHFQCRGYCVLVFVHLYYYYPFIHLFTFIHQTLISFRCSI